MKIAIMQPYLFPYIGYFQLINAVDTFVIYDDVNFIKQGWINRNNILIQGKANAFVLPLKEISSFKKIKDTEIDFSKYESWKNKFLKTIEQSYKKAPFFVDTFTIIDNILNRKYLYISEINLYAITQIKEYLTIKTTIINSSSIYNNDNLKAQDRVLDICLREKADIYINAEGGKELYSYEDFKARGITLFFIKSNNLHYTQFNKDFVPWLSIIDVMMFNSVPTINEYLHKYSLS